MKFDYRLTRNNQQIPLISHDVRLSYSKPGRASFTVESAAELQGIVHFTMANTATGQRSQFYGYIERSTPVGDNRQLLFCREKSAVLQFPLPLSFRNITLKTLLQEIKAKTGLQFAIPKAGYMDHAVPFFINTGSGYHALQQIGRVFGIEDYLWQQKRDGNIYLGSWQDSHWKEQPLTLPDNLFTKHSAAKTAELLAIPGLRPGYLLNGKRLKTVDLKENKMVVSWA